VPTSRSSVTPSGICTKGASLTSRGTSPDPTFSLSPSCSQRAHPEHFLPSLLQLPSRPKSWPAQRTRATDAARAILSKPYRNMHMSGRLILSWRANGKFSGCQEGSERAAVPPTRGDCPG
jgi:hypothetical protein